MEVLLIREGLTQGDPLYMIIYGLSLYLMTEKIMGSDLYLSSNVILLTSEWQAQATISNPPFTTLRFQGPYMSYNSNTRNTILLQPRGYHRRRQGWIQPQYVSYTGRGIRSFGFLWVRRGQTDMDGVKGGLLVIRGESPGGIFKIVPLDRIFQPENVSPTGVGVRPLRYHWGWAPLCNTVIGIKGRTYPRCARVKEGGCN